jgi:hypothetical protein
LGSLVRLSTLSVGLVLLLPILNFDISLQIGGDDQNNVCHYKNVLIRDIFLNIEVDSIAELHQTTLQWEAEVSQSEILGDIIDDQLFLRDGLSQGILTVTTEG